MHDPGCNPVPQVGEGTLELLVLLAASWDEAVQQEAALALANFALQPQNRRAVVQVGRVCLDTDVLYA